MLGENQYPANEWFTRQSVVLAADLALPPDLPSSPYRFEIGLYLSQSGVRFDLPGSSDNSLTLGTVNISKAK